ncbi:VOC family protein [Peptoniphilus equinus]|uniref:Aldoketomutase n=1 Tax=Peptoniphilus equinus TaxID=3016343 RepID=A0ABY7QS99_9FIRM|nr:VOC family protein [Peptoniphilus equinus]WBW49672.1 VOC family protein [Peptoniphilus equinus]
MKYLHTCIRVGNLDASIAFYEKALGFEVTRTKDFPDKKFTLVYLAQPTDYAELELTYNYDTERYELGDGYGHIALECEDFDATYERLKSEGYDVTDKSGLSDGSDSFFFIKDPDGYKIEIIRAK